MTPIYRCPCDDVFDRVFGCRWHTSTRSDLERVERIICSNGLRAIHEALVDAGFDAVRGSSVERGNLSAVLFRHVDDTPGSIAMRCYAPRAAVYRIQLDQALDGSVRALRELGIAPSHRGAALTTSKWRGEINVEASEVAAIAEWLPQLLRQAPDLHEVPPIAIGRVLPYSWSDRAWAEHSAWRADEASRTARRAA